MNHEDNVVTIGVDVGGTAMKAGVVAANGQIFDSALWPAGQACATPGDFAAQLAGHLRPWLDRWDVAAVGLGIAGLVRGDGTVVRAPNYPKWTPFRPAELLADAGVDVPVAADNDANAAALGEAAAGAARGRRNFLLVTVGTGVGGAAFLDGRLWRGARGFAGEFGHVVVEPEGRPCGCGNRGCLEQYASLQGMRHDVRERALDFDDAAELLQRTDLPKVLARRAAAGHAPSRTLFERMGWYLGVGLGGLLNAFDMPLVVVGGGLASAFDLFAPALRDAIAHHSFDVISAGLRIVPASLGGHAGVIGAARLPLAQR